MIKKKITWLSAMVLSVMMTNVYAGVQYLTIGNSKIPGHYSKEGTFIPSTTSTNSVYGEPTQKKFVNALLQSDYITNNHDSSNLDISKLKTNYIIGGVMPQGQTTSYKNQSTIGILADRAQLTYQSPQQLYTEYGINKDSDSSHGVIAFVEWAAPVESDLEEYSNTFNLSKANLTTYYSTAKGLVSAVDYPNPPMVNSSVYTSLVSEANLDTQVAHAISPLAQLYVVVVGNDLPNFYKNFDNAVIQAIQLVQSKGGGELSFSVFANGEPKSELATILDKNNSNVVVTAATGDDGGLTIDTIAQFSHVIAAGGTKILADDSTQPAPQSLWYTSANEGGNGGVIPNSSPPEYQKGLGYSGRATPDISFDADPASGVAIFLNGNEIDIGGTSASAPALAAMINRSGLFKNTKAVLNNIYAHYFAPGTYDGLYDVTQGHNPGAPGNAKKGYDTATGLGTPYGLDVFRS
ncbi:S8/S53 family peptidase [Facilibium subflavum]|uniref:hypothetical protein n=1 Tax=Facilibium subflavum TaxID=2219058 RepID=UPI000E64F64F|nr:hypothetical protein [Facilibium subflavum]